MGGEIGCSAEGMECISSRIHKHLYQHMHGLSLAGIIWIRSNLPILQLFSHKKLWLLCWIKKCCMHHMINSCRIF